MIIDQWTILLSNPDAVQVAQYRHVHKTKGWVYLEAVGQNFLAEPSVNGIVLSVRDISKRKLMEEQLAQNEAKFRQITENISDVVWMADLNFITTYVSPSIIRLTGDKPDEHIKRSLIEKHPPESVQKMKEVFEEEIKLEDDPSADKNRVRKIEVQHYHSDGSLLWVSMNVSAVRDKNGVIIGFQGVTRDITKRKHAELELFEAHKKNKAILEALPDLMFVFNREGVYLDYFASSVDELAIPPEIFLNKNVKDVLPQYLSEISIQYLNRLFETGVTQNFNYSVNLESKESFFEARMVLLDKSRALCIVRDVTLRKTAEENLRMSEEKYRMLFEANKDSITILKIIPDGSLSNYIEVNDAACSLTGYSREEHKEIVPFDLEPDVTFDDIMFRIKELKQKGNVTFETTLKHKNGTRIFVHVKAILIKYLGEDAILNITRDITDLKKSEEEIQKSIELLNRTEELARIGSWIYDVDSQKITWSNEVYRIFGIEPQSVVPDYTLFMNIVHPDDREKVSMEFTSSLEKNTDPYDIEHRIIKINSGEVRFVREKSYNLRDENDKVTGAIGFVHDITENKLAEQALLDSEEKLRKFFDVSHDAIFIVNENGFFIDANKIALERYKYNLAELNKMTPVDLAGEKLASSVGGVVKNALKQEQNFEWIHKTKDGYEFPVEIHTKPIALKGRPFIFVEVRDISERKKAEEEIVKFKTISDKAIHGNVIADMSGSLVYVNDYMANIHGYEPDELIGKQFHIFHDEQQLETVKKLEKLLVSNGQFGPIEVEHSHKNGTVFQMLMSGTLIRNEKNEPMYLTASAVDLTEKKKAENELIHSHNLLQYIIEHSRSAIAIHDRDLRYVYVSQRYLEEYNLKDMNIIGKHHYEVFPDLPQKWKDVHQKALKGEVSSSEMDSYPRDNGTLVWTRWECRPWYESDGSIGGFIIYTEMITDRVNMINEIKENESKYRLLTEQLSEMIIFHDLDGNIIEVNNECCIVLEYTKDELCSMTVFDIQANNSDKEERRKLYKSMTVGTDPIKLQSLIIKKDKSQSPVEVTFRKVLFGTKEYILSAISDITDRKKVESIIKTRLHLTEFSQNHNADEILSETLDVVESLTESTIGFYNFVDEEKGMIELQKWSTRTIKEYCSVTENFDMHYPISNAGVWTECIHKRKPVIHNNYEALKHKKGLPEGHAPLIRELVVPIIRNNKIRAVYGLGNKPFDYSQEDVDIVSQLGDIVFDIVEKKIAEENLVKVSKGIEQSPAIVVITDLDGKIEYVNPKFTEVTGYTKEEAIGQNPKILKSGHHNEYFYKDLWDTIQSGHDWQGELLNKKKNGDLYWESVLISPIKNEKGRIISFIAIKEDVTTRKMLQKELVDAKEKAEESEERYQAFVQQSSEGIYRLEFENPVDIKLGVEEQIDFIYDNAYVAEYNKRFMEMYNAKSVTELIGKRLIDFHEGRNHPINRQEIRDFITSGYRIVDKITEERTLDGWMVHFSNNTVGIIEKDKLVRMWGTQMDITDRVLLHQELVVAKEAAEMSEFKVRSMFENTLTGFMFINPEGAIIEANPAVLKIIGSPSMEATKAINLLTFEPIVKTGFSEDIKICLSTKQVITNEVLYKSKWGKEVYIKYFLIPIFTNNKATGVWANLQDLTDLWKTQKDLIKAKEKAEESDRLKSAFLANMSHEIRTPMNAIMGFAQLLKEKQLTKEKQNRFLGIINDRSRDLLRIINDIIDISKIEANQLIIEETPFSVNKMLLELYTTFDAEIQKENRPNLKLNVETLFRKEEATIISDENRLKQILINLIHNAIKFTDVGKIDFGYTINMEGELEFYVKDTGIGISKKDQKIIFERFRQADDSATRKYGGTGLGLPICKNIVSMLGGKIWVESEIGNGSAFFFTVPYKPFEDTNIKSEESKSIKYNWKDKTILIVEDDPSSLSYLLEILDSTQIIIEKATNGSEMHDILTKNKNIRLVLLDINLPEISGNQLVKQIKELKPAIPVVAQSAYSMAEEKKLSMECGFDDYITKPVDAKLLLSIINKYIKE